MSDEEDFFLHEKLMLGMLCLWEYKQGHNFLIEERQKTRVMAFVLFGLSVFLFYIVGVIVGKGEFIYAVLMSVSCVPLLGLLFHSFFVVLPRSLNRIRSLGVEMKVHCLNLFSDNPEVQNGFQRVFDEIENMGYIKDTPLTEEKLKELGINE